MFWSSFGLLRESTRILLERRAARSRRGDRPRRSLAVPDVVRGPRPPRLDGDERLPGALRARPRRRRAPTATRSAVELERAAGRAVRPRPHDAAGRARAGAASRQAGAARSSAARAPPSVAAARRQDRDRHRRLERDRRGDRAGARREAARASPAARGASTGSRPRSRSSSTSPTRRAASAFVERGGRRRSAAHRHPRQQRGPRARPRPVRRRAPRRTRRRCSRRTSTA